MKSRKGLSLLIWVIIIVILVLFAGSIGAYLIGLGGQAAHKIGEVGEQVGIATHILPKAWYEVTITDAVKGEINFTVQDTNGTETKADDVYVTDFDPNVGYKVYENNSQTAVQGVREFPVAYIAVVADPASNQSNMSAPGYTGFWGNLTNIKFREAQMAVIPVTKVPSGRADFSKGEITNPTEKGDVDYWGALAKAGESLPTVPTKRNIGRNFLAVILVSEGNCSIHCDPGEKGVNETLRAALGISPDVHFYMLRSSCKIPVTDISNATLESYKGSLAKAKCYTNATYLIDDLVRNDLAPITLEYEPKHEALYVKDYKSYNLTVEVTKRLGVLGAESAYSGKGSTSTEKMPKY